MYLLIAEITNDPMHAENHPSPAKPLSSIPQEYNQNRCGHHSSLEATPGSENKNPEKTTEPSPPPTNIVNMLWISKLQEEYKEKLALRENIVREKNQRKSYGE